MPENSSSPHVPTDSVLGMLRLVIRRFALVGLAVTVVVCLLGVLVAGMPGLWGALIASAVGLVFMGVTVVSMYVMAGRGPEMFQIVLLGGWLVKIVLLVLLLNWLSDMTFYHRTMFIVAIVAIVVAGLTVETLTVMKSRIPYVQPSKGEDQGS
ncbi:hypothetical protein [Ruania alba]|uniref:ATP synthase protein I n=1 Tax=Ruania alba TaxID=648782 RepID=A0A1H5NED6_9MICO|nr:hypothetical protein [Ruania alba]SEE99830.1 hypothetical protein SAMN04488554_4243 [Ruania alba]